MLNSIIGEVIREFRLSKKLSQEKVAELSGLDRTYISLIERGKRQPTIQTLFRIAKALDVSPSEITKTIQDKHENSK